MFAAKTVWTAIIWAVGLGPLGKMAYGNAWFDGGRRRLRTRSSIRLVRDAQGDAISWFVRNPRRPTSTLVPPWRNF
jgi:hypothetical protein